MPAEAEMLGAAGYTEWTEKDLDKHVRNLCKQFSWRLYHTYWSKRSPKGFVDFLLVRPPRIIFAETKSPTGRVRPE